MRYKPDPIDTSKVLLSEDLIELTELLAKNAHDTWARQRMAEGWRPGQQRDDARKEHPGLVPYENLSESEKEYDRNTAMETLKVLLAGVGALPVFGIAHGHIRWTSAYDIYASGKLR